jgi:hypothetical protein
VLADALSLGLRRARFLVAAGVVVFVPIGLIEALQLDQVQTSDFAVTHVLAVAVVGFLFVAITLLGEVLYSGVVAAAAKEDHGAPRRPVGELVRHLPYGRLLLTDVLYVLSVGVGLVILVVPAFAALAFFSLAAVVIECESASIPAAFRRSYQLVRGSFWRTLGLVVGLAILTDLVSRGIEDLVALELGHSYIDRWVEATVSSIATAPLFALPIVALYFALAELTEPVATSSGTVTNSKP